MPDLQPAARDGPQLLAALTGRLHERAASLGAAGDWAECLQLAARMPGHSFANILLLSARPGPALVRGYAQWQKAGRQVRRGEQGTRIFDIPRAPARPPWLPGRDGNPEPEPGPAPGWRDAERVTVVWDITQTDGPPVTIRQPAPAGGADGAGKLWDGLCWLARRAGYAVTLGGQAGPDGLTVQPARRIIVPDGPGQHDALAALAHQLGHALCHAPSPRAPGGACCAGARRAEAQSVAYVVLTRYGLAGPHLFSAPPSWAGTDPRAQPAAAIIAVGEHVTAATARVTGYLDKLMPARKVTLGATAPPPAATRARQAAPRPAPAAAPGEDATPAAYPEDAALIARVLADAQAFYTARLPGSWAPGYLHSRQVSDAAAAEWGIGYAPGGWTALTDHLRELGHGNQVIQDAGLARPSSRGTLIDHFRDRLMFPVHAGDGTVAGFLGRARPGAGPEVPKYINSPETAAYSKGSLLLGLTQARARLAGGAVPVITEGPFDVIAVSVAGQGRYAGLAPCGTALTARQAALLGTAADLAATGVIAAFDSDTAGRKAAARAYAILRPHTARLQAASLDGKDPAEIIEHSGSAALAAAIRDGITPMSAILIDATLAQWQHRLRDIEGPLLAMRAAAVTIAGLLPETAREQIRDTTAGREIITTDDMLRPVSPPELAALAKITPAETAYLVVRAACHLGFDITDVLAEVANAVTRTGQHPDGPARAQVARYGTASDREAAARTAAASFPHPPLPAQPGPARHPQPARRPAPPARTAAARRC